MSGMRMNVHRSIVVLLFCLGLAFPAHGQTYDPATDFSTTQNPPGAWRFGWSAGFSGKLHIYQDCAEVPSSHFWEDKTILSANDPHVGYSWHDAMVDDIPPHKMLMHPGRQNQFSHCIFTAPSAGIYDVHATFTSIARGGPHVYILQNGMSMGGQVLREDKPWAFAPEPVTLETGDTIDFAVGVGLNRVFFSDETTFSLVISKH
jgi:hypothetical protein